MSRADEAWVRRIEGDLELVQARVAGVGDQLTVLRGDLEVLIERINETSELVGTVLVGVKEART